LQKDAKKPPSNICPLARALGLEATKEGSVNHKFIKELHKSICRSYIKKFGGLVSQLKSWNFNFADCVTIPEIKVVVDQYCTSSTIDQMIPKAFEELVEQGYLEEREWGYSLTDSGLKHGSQGVIKKIINYLNQNPGLAIVISIISLVVSISVYINS
tara:strand:- start:1321 stop:1791 length:471 start_codon:yes stop_codon:yes gene_type:complete